MTRWILLAGVLLSIDQISKWLCTNYLQLYKIVAVMPCLNLRLAHNAGAAFGLLASENGWQRVLFIIAAMVISSLIIYWLYKLDEDNSLEGLALALILGGALGNLFDRIWYGYVIDFIDFYVGSWHWYTFNIADIAICLGATIFAIVTLIKPNEAKAH